MTINGTQTMTVQKQVVDGPADYAATVDRLAAKAILLYEQSPPDQRVMIAISGVPGSGKTTLAAAVAAKIQDSLTDKKSTVSIIPMDGFHLYREQLAAMPNAAEAIHRRGAAFTFAADRLYDLARSLREPLTDSTKTIHAPSFDHAVKDPIEDDIAVPPSARIVIFEGLYLSLDKEPWRLAAALMDGLWFLTIDQEVARKRLVKRHVASGIVADLEAAEHRVASTDMLNAHEILNSRLSVDELIEC